MLFCYDGFKGYYQISDDEMSKRYPAIKVLKIADAPWNTENIPFSYVILCGFVGEKPHPPFIVISHCPFCGKKLSRFYNKEVYVNEKWSSLM